MNLKNKISLLMVMGAAFMLNNSCLAQQASYPIDSKVVTTVERTIVPVAVPSTAAKIFPYELSKYAENGYGKWQDRVM